MSWWNRFRAWLSELIAPPKENPWLAGAGMFKDDPMWGDFLAQIEAERKESYEQECVEEARRQSGADCED